MIKKIYKILIFVILGITCFFCMQNNVKALDFKDGVIVEHKECIYTIRGATMRCFEATEEITREGKKQLEKRWTCSQQYASETDIELKTGTDGLFGYITYDKDAFGMYVYDNNSCPEIYYTTDGNESTIYYEKDENGDLIIPKNSKSVGAQLKKVESEVTPDMAEDIEEAGDNTGKYYEEVKTEEAIILSQIEIDNKNLSDGCDSIFRTDSKFMGFLRGIFLVIRIAAPLVLIILTMLDFTKTIGSGDEQALKISIKKFVKRAIICALIFLVPTFVNLFLDISDLSGKTCTL